MSPFLSTPITLLAAVFAIISTSSALPLNSRAVDPTSATALLNAYTAPLSNGKLPISAFSSALANCVGSGSTSLPTPGESVLKAVTIGRGTQNYTCASSTSADKPIAVGAVATLFDVKALLPFLPPREGQDFLDLLPSLFYSFPREALEGSIIPQAGMHYFNIDANPVFNLSMSGNGILVGNKTGDIVAPQDSVAGAHGAVDWLALSAKSGSNGLAKAYRTNTASGKAPATCEGQTSTIEIPYSAQYYFFSS